MAARSIDAQVGIANKPLAWALAVAVPPAAYFVSLHLGASSRSAIFLAVVSVPLLLWTFSLMADFIPALIALLLLLIFDLAPPSVILSGFSSDTFLIAVSVMGLGAVITSSGLARRYTLWLLKTVPQNTFAYQAAIFATGFIFNPVVPMITGRAAIVGPVVNDLAGALDETSRREASTLLYLSGLDSINYLSPMFLTAAPANLMVFALLPSQEQQSYQFMFWLYAASVSAMVMLILYFAVAVFLFRPFRRAAIDRQAVEQAWRQQPPMSRREKAALFGIGLMALGVATNGLHRIPLAVVVFSVICSLLIVGALTRDGFVRDIDWAFLFLLASLIGILACMKYLSLDNRLSEHLFWLQHAMRQDFAWFVLLLTLTMLVVRLLIPLNSAILIFAAALIPLASGAGISPWVVGFVILIMAETAFFGYQSPYILFFRGLTRTQVSYSEKEVRLFHGVLVAVKLAAVYAAIPFWRAIGVL